MKTFTLKDFIKYNNPCFSCNNSVNLTINRGEEIFGNIFHKTLSYNSENNEIIVDLLIKYKSILQLKIYPKTNRFITSDDSWFSEFLESFSISFKLDCSECETAIDSKNIEFDIINGFFKPFSIKKEWLNVIVDDEHYAVSSNFDTNYSRFIIFGRKENIEFNSKLLSLSKIKTRENLINKIKTYAMFS